MSDQEAKVVILRSDEDGALLFDIALEFQTRPKCVALATLLLAGEMSGLDFVKGRTGHDPNWPMIALEALNDWCRLKERKATGDALMEILQRIQMGPTAEKFRSKLVIDDDVKDQAAGAASKAPRPPLEATELRDDINYWDMVITPLLTSLTAEMDADEIMQKCLEEGLISNTNKKTLQSRIRAGWSPFQVNDQLIDMLRGTLLQGYEIFKNILGSMNLAHRKLLQMIVDKESEVLEENATRLS